MSIRTTTRNLASGLLIVGTLLSALSVSGATDPRETPPSQPAISPESTIACPAESAIAIASDVADGTAYRKGFVYGCTFFDDSVFYAKVPPNFSATDALLYDTVFDFLNDQSGAQWGGICNGERAASKGFAGGKTSWVSGCFAGLSKGVQVFDTNIAGHKPLAITQSDVIQSCSSEGKTVSKTPPQRAEFDAGCAKGYYGWVDRDVTDLTFSAQDNLKNNFCNSGGTTHFNNGCIAGWLRAAKDYADALPVTPGPSADVINFVSKPEIAHCNVSQGIIDGFGQFASLYAGARDQGCYNGFFRGFNASNGICDGNPYSVDNSVRGTRQKVYNRGFIDGCNSGYQLGHAQRNQCISNNVTPNSDNPFSCTTEATANPSDPSNPGNTSGSGIVPNCNPTLAPNAPPGPDGVPPCGVNQFVELIKNIMKYLMIVVIPIAVLALGWGGFQIMTAAGNTEKVSSGIGTIKLAVIGIVIMFASYFIVQAIFLALGVEKAFTPGGL